MILNTAELSAVFFIGIHAAYHGIAFGAAGGNGDFDPLSPYEESYSKTGRSLRLPCFPYVCYCLRITFPSVGMIEPSRMISPTLSATIVPDFGFFTERMCP